MDKQVDRTHYNFTKYYKKERWLSLWYQLTQIINLSPNTVLEIGPGLGLLKANLSAMGINIKTVDIDDELNPDYVASVGNLPFDDNSFDCVSAFQILEHLEYGQSLEGFAEIVRISKRHILISLPDRFFLLHLTFWIPKLGGKMIYFPNIISKFSRYIFNGEHYWELNTKGYPVSKFVKDTTQFNVRLVKSFVATENPYHRFFIFEKLGG